MYVVARVPGAVGVVGDVRDPHVHTEEPVRFGQVRFGDLDGGVQEPQAPLWIRSLADRVSGDRLELGGGPRVGEALQPAVRGPDGYRAWSRWIRRRPMDPCVVPMDTVRGPDQSCVVR